MKIPRREDEKEQHFEGNNGAENLSLLKACYAKCS
jgi:hypothetical protein